MKSGLMHRLVGSLILITAISVLGVGVASAGGSMSKAPKVSTSLRNATSIPLRQMPMATRPEAPVGVRETMAPGKIPRYQPALGKEAMDLPIDTSVQRTHPVDARMSATVANFEGMGNTLSESGVLPPDTVGDVGPNHYVQMVNSRIAVWDKTGTLLMGPVANNSIWTALGGICASRNDGGSIVLYDQAADRWLISQFALGSSNFHECVAISTTPDPTGAWHLYDFLISSTKMNDYPHFGVWPDGYYMSINQFSGPSWTWAGQGAVAFERDQMLAGNVAQMIYFDDPDSSLGAMLPSDWDGAIPPPLGAPNLFTQLEFGAYTGTSLDIWEFHVDWTTPANSTFSALVSPVVTAYDGNMCGDSRNCIPQPGGTPVDAIADQLMYRVQYRNFGTHESMVTNHTVDSNGSDLAGVRWYELRSMGGGPWTVVNHSTYAPDSEHRWMGSAAMDAQGNIAVGYSVSSATTSPSIRYAGRLAGDPPNTLPQAEVVLIAGSGYQTHSSGRWGEYSSMNVDPVDDCTFWYTQEYYDSSGLAPWQTRIGSFKFPGCAKGPSGALEGMLTDAGDSSPIEGALVKAGALTTTTDATGVYTFANVPVGTYDVTASAWTYLPATVNGVAVVDSATTTLDFALTGAPMSTVSGTVTDGSGQGWPLYARIDIAGAPLPPLFTDPLTGAYGVALPEGKVVTFDASAAGYVTEARGITVPAGPSTEDFALLIDGSACDAPGYKVKTAMGPIEDFETFPPLGWTVVDYEGSGVVWSSNVAWGDPNYTSGTGKSAALNSDKAGSVEYDSGLISPTVSVTGGEILNYKASYKNWSADLLELDIDIDSAGWVNLLSWNENHGVPDGTPGEAVSFDLSAMLADASSYQLRWHYYNPTFDDYDWYAQIDEVNIVATCELDTTVGGLLLGNVYDGNTSDPLNGATVFDMSVTYQTTSMPTPDDPGLDDGFYQLALPTGPLGLDATALYYGTDTQSVTVPAAAVVAQNFELPAGLLVADPPALNISLPENMTRTLLLNLDNLGAVDANFELVERNLPYVPRVASGPWAEQVRHASPKHPRDMDAQLLRHAFAPINIGTNALPNPSSAGDVIIDFDPVLADPWGIAFDTGADDLWVTDSGAAGGDDQTHQFLTDGTATGNAIDNTPWVADWVADGAYDPDSKTFWQVNVGGDNCIHESDPLTMLATGDSICPPFGTSERGLAYDPLTDTFYAGSWLDGIINHFGRDGTILDSVDVQMGISGLAFNPDTGHLFVISNDAASVIAHDVVVLDVNATYARIASFYSGLEDYTQAGLGIDCDAHLWAVVQPGGSLFPAGRIVEYDSGEATACSSLNIDWLTESPVMGTLAALTTQSVDFIFDSTGLAVGTYEAHVQVQNDTPYGIEFVPVTLEVTPNAADLVVTKTDGETSVMAGVETGYTIVVTNNGPEPVTGATVTDTFVAELSNPTWNCVPTGGAVCDTTQKTGDISETVDLPVGDSVTYNVTAQIDQAATGTLSNTAAVVSSIPDSNPGDESATDDSDIEPSADLLVTKTDDQTSVKPGAATSYTIVVTNNGPDPVLGATVTDDFAAELLNPEWVCAPTGGAACTTTKQTGNISDIVNLPVGSTLTYSVTALVDVAAAGTLSNTATVAATLPDPTPDDRSATDDTSILPSADLVVTKTDDLTSALAGTKTSYTITVTNTGPNFVAGVNVTDVFAAELLNPTWSCVASGGAVCDTTPKTGDIDETVALRVGGVVTFSVDARIQTGSTGTLTNEVQVASPVDNPGDDSAADDTSLLCSGDDETLTGHALVNGDVVVCDVPGAIYGLDLSVGAEASLSLIGIEIGFSGTLEVAEGGMLSVGNP